jgi:hypothetical protein
VKNLLISKDYTHEYDTNIINNTDYTPNIASHMSHLQMFNYSFEARGLCNAISDGAIIILQLLSGISGLCVTILDSMLT